MTTLILSLIRSSRRAKGVRNECLKLLKWLLRHPEVIGGVHFKRRRAETVVETDYFMVREVDLNPFTLFGVRSSGVCRRKELVSRWPRTYFWRVKRKIVKDLGPYTTKTFTIFHTHTQIPTSYEWLEKCDIIDL